MAARPRRRQAPVLRVQLLRARALVVAADVVGAATQPRQQSIHCRLTSASSSTGVLAQIDRAYPAPARATVADFVNHIDYAVKLIGIDHVGISSDFDGGGGVDGWNDAAETFNVTLELVKRGYTEEQIAKIWSGNLLRVMGEVQKRAAK